MPMRAARADNQGGGFARRECPGFDEDPVIGPAVMRKIDHRRGIGGLSGNRHELRRRRDLAGIGLRSIGVVDDGKIGVVGAVGDLNPHGRGGRIIGEADMKVGMPEGGRDLERVIADSDARVWAGHQFDTGKKGRGHQGGDRYQNLETQHGTQLADLTRDTTGLWLAERKQNSLPPG